MHGLTDTTLEVQALGEGGDLRESPWRHARVVVLEWGWPSCWRQADMKVTDERMGARIKRCGPASAIIWRIWST